MLHARTINQMIANAERYGKHLLVDLAIHFMPISVRIIRTRQVNGIMQGYVLATGKWQAIKTETLREL